MKTLVLTTLLIFFLAFTVKKKEFTPPGTVRISDTLYADEAEISNFSWREYEYSVKVKYGALSLEHKAVLPDTTVWRNTYSFNEPYVQYYYRHPAYKDFPVLGISYEQVLGYCKWRTERVKDFLSKAKKYDHLNFYYRLPTKAEWEVMSFGGTQEFSNNGRNEKGQLKMNIPRSPDAYKEDLKFNNGSNDVTAPVYSYWKNFYGLYNMIGNVAEMVQEKGISKGGGWLHQLEQCRVGKDIPYTKAESWLGFRCVCVVKK